MYDTHGERHMGPNQRDEAFGLVNSQSMVPSETEFRYVRSLVQHEGKGSCLDFCFEKRR